MADRDALRASLEAQEKRLTRRVGNIEGDLRRAKDPDSEERATEAENDEVLEGLDASGLEQLAEIRTALDRMDAGTYGICTSCDEPIAEGRLEALPATSRCVDCAD